MVKLFKGFDHTNTSDVAESVVKITSSEAEPKHIEKVVIVSEVAQDGKLFFHVERESLFEGGTFFTTNKWTAGPPYEFPIDMDIPIGQSFEITLLNAGAGAHAGISGFIMYEAMT